ncbi:type II secretion system protein [Paucibacter sp. AS339]|uniref:type II secretion system protein n=1 Tax=Paucibacter hankyongi TaxID=3133434 RepID=UPI0030A0E3F0
MATTRSWRQRGFTYLSLLFFVAMTAAALATLGQSWQTATQREKERELEFRGGEIARAIASYQKASGGQTAGQGQNPLSLDDLLADRRGPMTRYHLRRLYPDPFTGHPDWVLVPDPANPRSFNAVHSRSEQALLRQTQTDGTPIQRARDWVFSPTANAATAPRPEGVSETASDAKPRIGGELSTAASGVGL